MRIHLSILIAVSLFITIVACKHEAPPVIDPAVTPADGNFPPEVAKIFLNKCATSGCHNAQSYKNAGALLLDTWDHLLNGGSNGASVVAYSPENSPLLYFINPNAATTHDAAATPTMPYNGAPLSIDEYNTIKNWIKAGAPDKNGNIPFASNADTRQKTYIVHQGNDRVAVIDNERKVVMRYIKIGLDNQLESAHAIKVSNDGRYAYVVFMSGRYLQKIDTRLDTVVASMDLTAHLANTGFGYKFEGLTISNDGSKLLTTGLSSQGAVVMVGTDNMEEIIHVDYVINPHGIMATTSFDTFYATSLYGNFIYKVAPFSGDIEDVYLDSNTRIIKPYLDPHAMIMSPDRTVYFLTCEYSNEVRVMNASNDKLNKVIPVGLFPQEFAISHTKPYLFVSCMRDNSSVPGAQGSIFVINYNTLNIVKRIDGNFFLPHGITVDDKNGTFTVVSAGDTAVANHYHTSDGKIPGWYSVYNLNTLEPLDGKRYLILSAPYAADTRYKQ